MEFAHTVPDAHQAVSGPVDLQAIARFKGQFEEGLVANWRLRRKTGSADCVLDLSPSTNPDNPSSLKR
jgi:hypothetical protein